MATTQDTEYSVTELLGMDEQAARSTLTVDQYDRWERLQDLHAEAAETKQQWAAEDEQVADIAVHADPDKLGTDLDLFGNDVLVHVDSEDAEFRAAAETLEEEFGETDTDEVLELPPEDRETIAAGLQEMLDAVILRWNGHDWADLDDATRGDVLANAREKWGVDGLLLAWIDITAAVNEEREDKLDVIESFRDPQRRGRR